MSVDVFETVVVNWGSKWRAPPEVQALIERRQRISLLESDAMPVQAIQEMLELTESVQCYALKSIAHGEVAWRVDRAGTAT